MSIKVSLSSDGLEEVFTPPTLKEMCLYKCLTTKEILTEEVAVDEATNGSEKLLWEKYRLKEPLQKDLVEALLDAGDEYLFQLTPKYEPVLAAIRMSQPEHLVKVHVNNTKRLTDNQLEWLISGGNVKSLDIHGCIKLRRGSLDAINKFGSKLEYLRIGESSQVLPDPLYYFEEKSTIRTPNLKTFIVSSMECFPWNATNYWRFLLQNIINNLEHLQISGIYMFETLDFLEQAKSKLSSLTLRNCSAFPNNANAWASLFKLDKLRSLDLVGSFIEEAFAGENVVQLLLTAMPNLTRLAVNPGLVKNIHVDTPIRGQGPVAKRLEFLGVMDNDADEIRKAKLLANEVAYFGTAEGELRILEDFSNRLNSGDYDSTLWRLLDSLNSNVPVPCKPVAVIGLLIKTIKNNGNNVVIPSVFLQFLKRLLATTTNVAAKLGNVLLDQCIEANFGFMRGCLEPEPAIYSDSIDIMVILDGELICCDHYTTVLPMVIRWMEIRMTKLVLLSSYSVAAKEHFKRSLKNIAQLLENAVDRFPGETDALWGMSSVPVIIKRLNGVMVSEERERNDLVEILSSMIASVRKMCLNSGPRRAAFHSANGVGIVMDLLKEIIGGCLIEIVADRDSFALLEIIKSILEDTKLDMSDSRMIASGLEMLLLSVNSQWEFWKSSNSQNSERETKHYFQLESISGLLNLLESDPRYYYKASAAVKEIMKKF